MIHVKVVGIRAGYLANLMVLGQRCGENVLGKKWEINISMLKNQSAAVLLPSAWTALCFAEFITHWEKVFTLLRIAHTTCKLS